MAKILQSNVRAKLLGGSPTISGYWATTDGGGVTRERENSWDGGGTYDILVGKVTAEDITLTRPYDPVTDDGWIGQLRRNMKAGSPCEYELSKQPVGANGVSAGKAESFPRCPVISVRTYQAAAGPEATAATVELVLATKGPAN